VNPITDLYRIYVQFADKLRYSPTEVGSLFFYEIDYLFEEYKLMKEEEKKYQEEQEHTSQGRQPGYSDIESMISRAEARTNASISNQMSKMPSMPNMP